MGWKLVATGMVAVTGIGVGVYERGPIEDAFNKARHNEIPSIVLAPTDPNNLPFALPDQNAQQATEGLVCPENVTSCKASNAIVRISLAGHTTVASNKISYRFKNAIIDIEDRRFLENDGCDAKAIVRAAEETLFAGKKEGGSGITRQDVSNIEPVKTPQELAPYQPLIEAVKKHYRSKAGLVMGIAEQLAECSEAIAYEQRLTGQEQQKKGVSNPKLAAKDIILTDYANRIDYGRATGIEDAAESFFGVHASELTQSQAIVLAVVVNLPSKLGLLYTKQELTPQSSELYSKFITAHHLTVNISDETSRNAFEAAIAAAKKSGDISPADGALIEYYGYFKARKELLIDRFQQDARAMLANGDLTQAQAHSLVQEAESYRNTDGMPFGMKLYTKPETPGADYSLADHLNARPFTSFALQEASTVTGLSADKLLSGGYTINTCFNTKDQKALNDAIQQAPALQHPDVNAAGVSLGPDGCVVAMVGNRDYSKLQINIATGKLGGGSGRTTGSSNKGFLVAANLNAGQHITDPTTLPKSVVVPNVSGQPSWVVNRKDECIDFGEKAPCSKKPDGTPITMADALAVSSNTWAAESVKEDGFQPTIDIMNGFGMNVPKPYTPSFILGIDGDPLHEAAGYEGLILGQGTARFTNGNPYYAVNSVIDPHGKIIYQRPSPTLHQVVSQANALQTTKALEEVINLPYSTAYGAIKSPGGPNSVAGKTGTAGIGNSTDNSDVWFSGAVRDRDDRLSRATAIWLGNDTGKVALGNGISSKTTAKIFGSYILNRPHTTGPADIAAAR